MKKILIIGAGWAGLSAAFYLSLDPNNQITVLEAAPQIGGRGRTIKFQDHWVDNGQHLLLNGYEEVKRLLALLKVPNQHYHTQAFTLQMLHADRPLYLPFPDDAKLLPGAWALLRARGLTLNERVELARVLHTIKTRPPLERDKPVQVLFEELNHPKRLIADLWQPLCLAALSTPIEKASAQMFLNVMQATFSQSQASQVLWPKGHLSDFLPNPILNHLRAHNHQVLCSQRVQSLLVQGSQCLGADTSGGRHLADEVILAVGPKQCASLLKPIPLADTLCADLDSFEVEAITTVYLKYAHALKLEHAFYGLLDSPFHWVFHRHYAQQDSILAGVITGAGPLDQQSPDACAALLDSSLRHLGLSLPKLEHWKVVREKQAAFSCTYQAEARRPTNTTALSHLYLAGDYTRTPYPATLEGAVLSGRLCAELLRA